MELPFSTSRTVVVSAKISRKYSGGVLRGSIPARRGTSQRRLDGGNGGCEEEERITGHETAGATLSSRSCGLRRSDDAGLIGAVSIGLRAGPSDAYRLIIGRGDDSRIYQRE